MSAIISYHFWPTNAALPAEGASLGRQLGSLQLLWLMLLICLLGGVAYVALPYLAAALLPASPPAPVAVGRLCRLFVPLATSNADPFFRAITQPTTLSAGSRTVYGFVARGPQDGIERIALGGTSQGNVFKAVRSMRPVAAAAAGSRDNSRQAELWGDEQWNVLKQDIEERKPQKIAINTSRTFAFADGLSSGVKGGMSLIHISEPTILKRISYSIICWRQKTAI